jgi:hypothetical protein
MMSKCILTGCVRSIISKNAQDRARYYTRTIIPVWAKKWAVVDYTGLGRLVGGRVLFFYFIG